MVIVAAFCMTGSVIGRTQLTSKQRL